MKVYLSQLVWSLMVLPGLPTFQNFQNKTIKLWIIKQYQTHHQGKIEIDRQAIRYEKEDFFGMSVLERLLLRSLSCHPHSFILFPPHYSILLLATQIIQHQDNKGSTKIESESYIDQRLSSLVFSFFRDIHWTKLINFALKNWTIQIHTPQQF